MPGSGAMSSNQLVNAKGEYEGKVSLTFLIFEKIFNKDLVD